MEFGRLICRVFMGEQKEQIIQKIEKSVKQKGGICTEEEARD